MSNLYKILEIIFNTLVNNISFCPYSVETTWLIVSLECFIVHKGGKDLWTIHKQLGIILAKEKASFLK